MPKKKTTYQRYKLKWRHCENCDLCLQRDKIVLLRAVRVPAPILFIGEAPGVSEDTFGRPFVGPAGQLLDAIIDDVGLDPSTYALTNLLGCIPKGEDGIKMTKMPLDAIKACRSRVVDCINVCKPELVIWVGNDPKTHGPPALKLSKCSGAKTAHLIHPAALLRMSELQQKLAIQRTRLALADAVENMEWNNYTV